MRIILCRHGETVPSLDDRYYLDPRENLTAKGTKQALQLASDLAAYQLHAIFSSPFRRCLATAELIASRHNLPIDIIPEIAEWNPGHWAGLTRTQVQRKFPGEYKLWTNNPAAYAPSGGETGYDVAARAIPALERTLSGNRDLTIVIVGHNAINRIILSYLLDSPIRLFRQLNAQKCGTFSLIEAVDGEWRLTHATKLIKRPVPLFSQTSLPTPPNSLIELTQRLIPIHTRLRIMWPNGRNRCVLGDGGHWTLPPHRRPVSVGKLEARFLFNLVALQRSRTILEIGTGFGYSALWLAAGAAQLNGDSRVFSIDDCSEGGLESDGLAFARWSAQAIGVDAFIRLVHGRSPEVLPRIFNDKSIDFAFIDGNHHGDHPRLDFEGILPYLTPKSIIAWHDIDSRYSVRKAFNAARALGWSGKVFKTSCRIGIMYRHPLIEQIVRTAFASALSALESPKGRP